MPSADTEQQGGRSPPHVCPVSWHGGGDGGVNGGVNGAAALADLAAATFILGKDSELTCTRTLYTTDFCKAVLTISMDEVAAAASPRLAALYRLWDALTGNRGSVTIFDVAPLLGALADDGHMSLLVPAECSLNDGVFRLEESIGRCGVWATARAAGSVRAALLDMLRRCAATFWSAWDHCSKKICSDIKWRR